MSRVEQFVDRLDGLSSSSSGVNVSNQRAAVLSYLEAARTVVRSTGCPALPTAPLAQRIDPTVELQEPVRDLVDRVRGLNDYCTELLSEGVRWQVLADRSRFVAALPDPYEAVLELISAGGSLEPAPAGAIQLQSADVDQAFPAWDPDSPPSDGPIQPLERWLWTRLVVRGLEPAGVRQGSYELVQGAAPAIDSGGLWVKKQGEEWLVGSAERGTVREIGTFISLGLASRFLFTNLTDVLGPWVHRQNGAEEPDERVVARALEASGLDSSQYKIGESGDVDGGYFAEPGPAGDGTWSVGYAERGKSSVMACFGAARPALGFLHTLATTPAPDWARATGKV